MSIIENLLDDAGVDDFDDIVDEADRNSANETVGRNHDFDEGDLPDPPGPPTTFDLPPFGQEQFDLLTDIDLTQGNPETGETESVFKIELEAEDGDSEPLDDESVDFDVTVTDHFGTEPFDDAPNDRLSGSTTVEFEGGEGDFTIGGDDRNDADLTLGFFGFLPEVNDVETIQIDTGEDVEIVDRTLELDPDLMSESSIAGTQEIEEGFTETIEERD